MSWKTLIPVFSVLRHMAPGVRNNSVYHSQNPFGCHLQTCAQTLLQEEWAHYWVGREILRHPRTGSVMPLRSRNWNILRNRTANRFTLQEVRHNTEPFIFLSLNCQGLIFVSRNPSLLVEASFQRRAWRVDIQTDANHSLSTVPHLENGEIGLGNNSSW